MSNTPFEDQLDEILSSLLLHTKIPLSSESISGFKERQEFNILRVTEAKAALLKLHKAAIVAELEALVNEDFFKHCQGCSCDARTIIINCIEQYRKEGK